MLGIDYTRTNPGFNLTIFNIIGRSQWYFADVEYPLVRTREHNVMLHGQGNYENVFSTLSSLPFYQDRIRSIDLGVAYQGVDSWRGVNNASLDFTQGFSVLGADKHAMQSRPRGNTGYLRTNYSASRLQGLTQRFSALVSVLGQYCVKPLLATEQYAYGGPYFGRGYQPSEFVGDSGIAAKAELRFDTLPEWKFLQGVQY